MQNLSRHLNIKIPKCTLNSSGIQWMVTCVDIACYYHTEHKQFPQMKMTRSVKLRRKGKYGSCNIYFNRKTSCQIHSYYSKKCKARLSLTSLASLSSCRCWGLPSSSSSPSITGSSSGMLNSLARLCNTQQATTTLHTFGGSSRTSPCRTWNRRFSCPITRSTSALVLLWDLQK